MEKLINIAQDSPFDSMEEWIQLFRDNCGSKPLLLIGNKVDMADLIFHEIDRQLYYEEGLEKAKEHELIGYIETSAKEFIRIDECFTFLARRMLELKNDGN